MRTAVQSYISSAAELTLYRDYEFCRYELSCLVAYIGAPVVDLRLTRNGAAGGIAIKSQVTKYFGFCVLSADVAHVQAVCRIHRQGGISQLIPGTYSDDGMGVFQQSGSYCGL